MLRRYDLMSSVEEFHRAMVPVLMRAVCELEERLIAVERRLGSEGAGADDAQQR